MKSVEFSGLEIELMAAEVHNIYIQHSGFNRQQIKYLENYSDLPEANKEFNRGFVRNIPKSIDHAGYSIVPIDNKNGIQQFTPNEIEALAEMEHERWSKERLDNGWQFGKIKDNTHKIHPCLVPWRELPEDEREKDRMLVRRIPQILSVVGYSIVRTNL